MKAQLQDGPLLVLSRLTKQNHKSRVYPLFLYLGVSFFLHCTLQVLFRAALQKRTPPYLVGSKIHGTAHVYQILCTFDFFKDNL
jgi:hypothetical protein